MHRRSQVRLSLIFLLPGLMVSLITSQAYSQANPIRLLIEPVEEDETPFVHDAGYPYLNLNITPVNEAGVPISGLTSANVTLRENGIPVSGFTLTPFVDTGQSISLLLAMDIGKSMADKMSVLKGPIIDLYSTLEQSDESGIIAFSTLYDGTTVDLGDPFPRLNPARELAFTNDEGALINLINALAVEENAGTPLYDALFKAVRMAATQSNYERRAVILLTAGRDSNREGDAPGSLIADADTVIEEARRFGIPLFIIGLDGAVDGAFLQRAATLTGGTYRHIGRDAFSVALLNDVVNQLKQKYNLAYQANQTADDGLYQLTVTIQSNLGTVEESVAFRAYYALQPLVRQVLVLPPGETLRPLGALETVRGRITVQPDVVARGRITAVNYYVDGSNEAIFSARQAPWSFTWNTSRLQAGQHHDLYVEVVDDAPSPNVGIAQVQVLVEACSVLCQIQQWLLSAPIYLTVLPGLLLVLFVVWVIRRSVTAKPIPAFNYPPVEFSAVPFAPDAAFPQMPAYQEHALFHRPLSPMDEKEDLQPLPLGTEVLRYPSEALAFLIVRQKQEAFRLLIETNIGRGENNHLRLDDDSVAPRHAKIILEDGCFTLYAAKSTVSTKVNRRECIYHPLVDGDRIEIGHCLLVFKQVK